MAARFTGKNVVVTGGNSGIGLASARQFAAEGARVLVVGRDPVTLKSAVESIGSAAIGCQADLSQPEELARVFEQARRDLGHIDVLFANAGISAAKPIEEVDAATWHRVINTNLTAPYFCVQAALPMMRKGSVVIFNASLAAHRTPPRMSIYAASKAGVVALGRTLASELAGRGIRVNVFSPGPIETAIMQRTEGLPPTPEMRQRMSDTPLGRSGRPEEAAAAVLFLASEDAAFITGSELIMDGGIATR